jgi:hypothetical protein
MALRPIIISIALIHKADKKGAAAPMLRGSTSTLMRKHPRMAISTEEGPDHPAELTSLVGSIAPNVYRWVCGPCVTNAGSIFTDVMFVW